MRQDKPLSNRQYCPVRMCLVQREVTLPRPSCSAENEVKKFFFQILLIYHETHSLNVKSTAAVGKLVLKEKKGVLKSTIDNYMYIACPISFHLSRNSSTSLSMNYDSCHPFLSESVIFVVIFVSQDEASFSPAFLISIILLLVTSSPLTYAAPAPLAPVGKSFPKAAHYRPTNYGNSRF
jgi:hypothetical protein